MLPRACSILAPLALAFATACVVPDVPPPPSETGPPPARTVVDPWAHGTPDGDVELHDIATSHGLAVKIDLVSGRRILTNSANEAIVEPGKRSVTINKTSYPLSGEVRWKDGKIFLPGDARVVFGENVRPRPVQDVKDPYAYLDTATAPDANGPREAPARAPLGAESGIVLPASASISANRAWSYIVIHHSATHEGGARSFDRSHARKWTYGLGYHFVIGNGSETRDGEIEVGARWTHQNEGIHGAHAGDKFYNQHGIGVCLVGDFNRDAPTARQLAALRVLCRHLMARYGIPKTHVVGHRDCRSGHTDCPGSRFAIDAFGRSF